MPPPRTNRVKSAELILPYCDIILYEYLQNSIICSYIISMIIFTQCKNQFPFNLYIVILISCAVNASVQKNVYVSMCIFVCMYTVGENIIATIKMRNNFCYPLKMIIFPILRQQYWTFLYCSPFSYRSSNFAIAKVVALNLFASLFV